MSTYKKIGYFYIGLFTLAGIFLLVAALIVFGMKASYKNAIYVETYFNESIQGLAVGSRVKYRGMEIGKIVDIAAISSIYDIPKTTQPNNSNRYIAEKYIYVKMAINTRHFKGVTDANIQNDIGQKVKNGLRVKLSAQGLTGNAYLELDYVKNGSNNPLQIEWKPENYYIPSTPSTLTFFSDNAQSLVEGLKKVEAQKTMESIKRLSDSATQTFDNADKLFAAYNHQTMEILTNLQAITQNLKMVSERAKTDPSSILLGSSPPKLEPNKL